MINKSNNLLLKKEDTLTNIERYIQDSNNASNIKKLKINSKTLQILSTSFLTLSMALTMFSSDSIINQSVSSSDSITYELPIYKSHYLHNLESLIKDENRYWFIIGEEPTVFSNEYIDGMKKVPGFKMYVREDLADGFYEFSYIYENSDKINYCILKDDESISVVGASILDNSLIRFSSSPILEYIINLCIDENYDINYISLCEESILIETNSGILRFNYNDFIGDYELIVNTFELNNDTIFSGINDLSSKYGGNQSFFFRNFYSYLRDENVLSIINKYYPNEELSNEELLNLFYKMSDVGCGYVASINTLYSLYSYLSEEDWFYSFGYPKYDSNGQNNYYYFFLDFFLYYQKEYRGFENISEILGNIEEQIDYVSNGGRRSDFLIEGADGIFLDVISKVLFDYIGTNYGYKLDYDVSLFTYNEKDIEQYSNIVDRLSIECESKPVVISVNYCYLYSYLDKNRNHILDDTVEYIDGGHAMTLVGTTEDGKWIVSSWGNKYLYDPYSYMTDTQNFSLKGFAIYSIIEDRHAKYSCHS